MIRKPEYTPEYTHFFPHTLKAQAVDRQIGGL